MRSPIMQMLPPNCELIVEINPPMADNERPVLMPPTKKTVVVRTVDTAHVSINNPTDWLAFVVLLIHSPIPLPPGVHEGITAFLAARKKN